MIIKDIHAHRILDFYPREKNEHVNSDDSYYHQIMGILSHELRTPVAIIKSNLQLLRKFNYSIDQSVLKDSFSLCDESVDLVTQFLDHIQLINGANHPRILPAYSLFRVKTMVCHLFSRLKQINLDGQRIILQWDLKDREIRSSQKYLHQILFMTLSNALKFSDKKVQLIISTSNHQLTIRVQDGGIGIAEDEIEMIFKPFYRAANVRHIAGSGLGLAIVYSLVERLSGGIQVSSAPGKGTTIQIIIPYEQPDQDTCN